MRLHNATSDMFQAAGRYLRYRRLFCCLMLCLLSAGLWLLPATAARAQEQEPSPVRLEVDAGYGGSYRVSQWFPVTVIATNDGPDMQGVLEWSYAGRDENMLFQREIDLPRGARKRLTFRAIANNFARIGEVQLRVGNEIVYTQQVRLEPIEDERFVVGVISSNATLLNSLSAMQITNTSGTSVVRMEAAVLPEDVTALTGMDAIFLHDVATADLTEGQLEALNLWVHLGGQLIVNGGANAERTVPGLVAMLPVTVGGLQSGQSLSALNALVANNPISDITTTLSEVTLRSGGQELDERQLLTTHRLGDGQVIFSAFDVGVLRAWTGEPDLWQSVLYDIPRFAPAASSRWQSRNLLLDVLQLPALNLPSFWVLLLFILGYILAVGPINFLVLRRLKRIDLAWITVPATVFLFVIATYSASFVIRGVSPRLLQATVVQGFEGQTQSQATMFLGIFSPQRNTYTLNFPSDTLVSTGRFDGMSLSTIELVWSDTASQMRDVLVDVSSLRTFIVERTVTTNVAVSSDLRNTTNNLEGTVENVGTVPLNDAMLVVGDSAQLLGTIPPGDTREVSVRLSRDNFPYSADVGTEGLINRQNMLNMIFDSRISRGTMVFPAQGNAPPSVLAADSVYLLAWQDDSLIEMHIDDTLSDQRGVTLYVIQLQQ